MIPVYVLLAFAAWTLITLLFSVGIYRWSRILTGRVEIAAWRHEDLSVGGDFYKRAMRAHGNCVENLPVYGAIVVVLMATGITGPWLDRLAILVIAARILQTMTHLSFAQTNRVVAFRFTFFFMQVLAMLGMAGIVLRELLAY